jgi:hypothetical protein
MTVLDGPREIAPHAFAQGQGPYYGGNVTPSHEQIDDWYYRGVFLCAIEGCGLKYEAPVHWKTGDRRDTVPGEIGTVYNFPVEAGAINIVLDDRFYDLLTRIAVTLEAGNEDTEHFTTEQMERMIENQGRLVKAEEDRVEAAKMHNEMHLRGTAHQT